jgi:hypothetical protein
MTDYRTEAERVAAKRFTDDTGQHEMTVLLDQDLHRHLLFRQPGTGMYWFEIVTWPGSLAIRGDMGNFVFARLTDMFEFFRGHPINPQYWGEKEVTGAEQRYYDMGRAKRYVLERWKEHEFDSKEHAVLVRDQLQMDVFDSEEWLDRNGAHKVLRDFVVNLPDHTQFSFYDTWEWDLTEYSVHFLWCLHAVSWAIQQYDASKVPA